MSVPEPSVHQTSPLFPRPEAKPRPPVCKKPSSPNNALPTPSQLGEKASASGNSGGNVKSIVSKFSHPETTVAPLKAHSDQPLKRNKRPPTVKAKPRRASLPQGNGSNLAPPLPVKTSRVLRQQSGQAKTEIPGKERNGVLTGRSEPDGKEVILQLIGGVEAEAEHISDTPPNSCCDQDCSCICHQHCPGMKLVWVPMEESEGEDDEEEAEEEDEIVLEEETKEEGRVGESVVGDEGKGSSGLRCPDEEGQRFKKDRFNKVLDGMIARGNRRKSDPGTQVIMTTLALKRPQSPPIPPKRSQSPLGHFKASEEQAEDIYEATLPVMEQTRKKICQELEIPLIRVRKPVRNSKLSSSNSEENTSILSDSSESQSQTMENAPPALPPRVPLAQDRSRALSQGSTPNQKGRIALPQPTEEDRRCLRPSSPNRSPPVPPTNAATPVRQPPLRDDKRHSGISLHSLSPSIKEQDEDGSTEGEQEDTEKDRVLVPTLKRGASFDWETRLQDEPLYQTYRATVITKEIRRQTVCRNISKTSADYHMDWSGRRGGVGNTAPGSTIPVPSMGQSSLWRDLPGVRDSGVLENLSPEQCKYQESMFEVLTSEASYLRSLKVLTEHFLESRALKEVMKNMDRKTLFSNVLRVREVSERFLKDLEERMDESLVFTDICDIIHYHAQHNFPAYIDYVRNQVYQEKTFTTLLKSDVNFATVINRLQEFPLCQRLPFMSFLLLPFQRITRIKMLIENILKRTNEGSKEELTALKALDSVSKIIEECNTQVGKMRQVEELIHLSTTLEFDKLKAIPIISQNRFLTKRGELQEMVKGGTLFPRPKFTPVLLFLFNDLLIIATKKGSERFVVLDHAHRSLVQIQPIGDDPVTRSPYEHCFNLTLLENHQGRLIERLMKAPSQSDLHRWMAAFPNPSNPDGDDDEIIYDDWDCPQVQCVEPYAAQQADELTLEPTEIINVVRKTNEGMCEGIRLSDGQKGWFPMANALEITNEHVRRRNLRERYRVMRAASAVTHNKAVT